MNKKTKSNRTVQQDSVRFVNVRVCVYALMCLLSRKVAFFSKFFAHLIRFFVNSFKLTIQSTKCMSFVLNFSSFPLFPFSFSFFVYILFSLHFPTFLFVYFYSNPFLDEFISSIACKLFTLVPPHHTVSYSVCSLGWIFLTMRATTTTTSKCLAQISKTKGFSNSNECEHFIVKLFLSHLIHEMRRAPPSKIQSTFFHKSNNF